MRSLSLPMKRVVVGSWVVIAVLSVVTLTLYVDNKRTRDCIATYMVADQRGSQVRFEVAAQERQKFKETLQVLISGEADPKKRAAAIEEYTSLLVQNDRIRKENPILPVPTECD